MRPENSQPPASMDFSRASHLNGAQTLAQAMPVHTPGTGSNGRAPSTTSKVGYQAVTSRTLVRGTNVGRPQKSRTPLHNKQWR